jgi:hypothetical protein
VELGSVSQVDRGEHLAVSIYISRCEPSDFGVNAYEETATRTASRWTPTRNTRSTSTIRRDSGRGKESSNFTTGASHISPRWAVHPGSVDINLSLPKTPLKNSSIRFERLEPNNCVPEKPVAPKPNSVSLSIGICSTWHIPRTRSTGPISRRTTSRPSTRRR